MLRNIRFDKPERLIKTEHFALLHFLRSVCSAIGETPNA